MAFTITQRVNLNTGTTSYGNRTTAAFTPTANSRLFVFAGGERDGNTNTRDWQISDSLGLTWTKLDESTLRNWATYSEYAGNCVAWYTDIGGSPASMTVTVDASAGNEFYSVIAFDVTGYDTGTPFAQASVDNGANVNPESNSVSGTLTLGSAPTNGNLVVAMFTSGQDAGGGFTTPSGYSVLVAQNQAYQASAVFYRSDTTTAAVTCSDLGQSVGYWGGIIFEMTAAAGSVPVIGAAAATLADVGVSAAGSGAVSGAVNITLANIACSAVGTVAISGAADITLEDVTAAAAGDVAVVGTASVTLGDMASTAAGRVTITGETAVSLAAFAVSADGVVPVVGETAVSLADVSVTSAGSVTASDIIGSASIGLADVLVSAAGSAAVSGGVDAPLADVGVAAAGVVAIEGTAALTLTNVTSSAVGTVPINGGASIALADMTISAAGDLEDAIAAVIAAYGTVTSPAASGAVYGPLAASWDYLLTEGGIIILTEDSIVLETESSSAARATSVIMPAAVGTVITQETQ